MIQFLFIDFTVFLGPKSREIREPTTGLFWDASGTWWSAPDPRGLQSLNTCLHHLCEGTKHVASCPLGRKERCDGHQGKVVQNSPLFMMFFQCCSSSFSTTPPIFLFPYSGILKLLSPSNVFGVFKTESHKPNPF